jgi:hypothetical protein
MTNKHPLTDLLHRATHRVPGVPAHADRPAGHQGTAAHDHATARPAPNHSHSHGHGRNHGRNHSAARPPRFLPGWQRRIAALFGREV